MTDVPFIETVTVHSTAQAVHRMLRTLIVLTVVLYVALTGMGIWVYSTSAISRDALCALRADLQARASSSQQFLDHQPNGALAVAIRTSIDGQLRTIKALRNIPC